MAEDTTNDVLAELIPEKNKGGRPKGSTTKPIDLQQQSQDFLGEAFKIGKRLAAIANREIDKINTGGVIGADNTKLLDSMIKNMEIVTRSAAAVVRGAAADPEKDKEDDGEKVLAGLIK